LSEKVDREIFISSAERRAPSPGQKSLPSLVLELALVRRESSLPARRRMRRALDFWQGLNTGIGDCATMPKAGPRSRSTMTASARA
jgi:hypothetical protein